VISVFGVVELVPWSHFRHAGVSVPLLSEPWPLLSMALRYRLLLPAPPPCSFPLLHSAKFFPVNGRTAVPRFSFFCFQRRHSSTSVLVFCGLNRARLAKNAFSLSDLLFPSPGSMNPTYRRVLSPFVMVMYFLFPPEPAHGTRHPPR